MQLTDKRKAELMSGPYTELIAQHELAIADIYRLFARMFPSAGTFWNELVKDELEHKALVGSIEEHVKRGEWAFKRPDFRTSSIVESMDFIALKKRNLQKSGMNMRQALQLALDFESGMVEAKFFDVLDGDSPRMMDVMQSLAAYSRIHRKHIEVEATRLKWKILGGGKRRLPGAGRTAPGSRAGIKSTHRTKQADIIGLLVVTHESMNALYETFAERLPHTGNLWKAMAVEEMQAANALRKLYNRLEDGNVFHNLNRFNLTAMRRMLDRIAKWQSEAAHEAITREEASEMALLIEKFLIEHTYHPIRWPEYEEFKRLSARFVEIAKDHVARLS